MQAVREKLNDMSTMRQAKAEARDEEKAEKELAKARLQEAEAEMDHHVNKAAAKVVQHEHKYPLQGGAADTSYMSDSYTRNPSNPGAVCSTDPAAYAKGSDPNACGPHTGGIGYATAGNMPGRPPTHSNLL